MAEHGFFLSEAARTRQRADLPRLLSAVRWRRRRRRLAQGAAVTMAVAALWFAFGLGAGPAGPGRPSETVNAPRWTVVHDDPGVLARCTVPTVERSEWWIDDAGLRALLREAERPDGIVRVRGQVLVSADAVDPFPLEP
jgi:hypothetical protein